jgi:hypothetical protein
MAAKAGLSLTMDHMGKVSQNATSLKRTGQMKPNCPRMIIGRSSTKFKFYHDRKSKMVTTAGHRLIMDPMGNMFQSASSLKPLGQMKPNCRGMIIGRSCTKFQIYMPIRNPRWPSLQNIY